MTVPLTELAKTSVQCFLGRALQYFPQHACILAFVTRTCSDQQSSQWSRCWRTVTWRKRRWMRLCWWEGRPVSPRCSSWSRSTSMERWDTARVWLVGWLLNVPATCQCISGAGLFNFMCWHTEIEVADQTFHITQSHRADQSQHWPCNVRRSTGVLIFKSLVWLDPGKIPV